MRWYNLALTKATRNNEEKDKEIDFAERDGGSSYIVLISDIKKDDSTILELEKIPNEVVRSKVAKCFRNSRRNKNK